MKKEVQSAIDFLTNILKTHRASLGVEGEVLDSFYSRLETVLCSHYEAHWFPEKPFKGSAYRCIRIVNQKMDPLLAKAGAQVGLSEKSLLRILPAELTLWVDPDEVSYRIGEDGSIGMLYDNQSNNSSSGSDGSYSDSDTSGSPRSYSPAQSQDTYWAGGFAGHGCSRDNVRIFPGSQHHMHQHYSTPQAAHMDNWEYLATFVAS